MDPYRCVLFEFSGSNQEKQNVLKYLEKNDQIYNWIVTESNKIRALIWWKGNVQFSVTPLRSFLKRLKRKIPDLEISRKMSTRDGVMRVFDGNVPVLSNVLTFLLLQRNSIFHLVKPVREHVLRLQYHLSEQYKQLKKTPPEEPTPLEVDDPPSTVSDEEFKPKRLKKSPPEEPVPLEVDDPPSTVSNEEFKRYKHRVNLLVKVTARIVNEVKELSQFLQPSDNIRDTPPSTITHPDEEDTSSSMITHPDEEDTPYSMITYADENIPLLPIPPQ